MPGPAKQVIEVARYPAPEFDPSPKDITTSLNRAGFSAKMREIYVRLTPRVPYVDSLGSLEFRHGWDLNPAWGVAIWEPGYSPYPGWIDINVTGLSTKATYALSIYTESTPVGANPQYTLLTAWVSYSNPKSPTWVYFPIKKYKQMLVVPIKPESDSMLVRVSAQDVSLWAFYAATLYA
jgi:hypothetical protein